LLAADQRARCLCPTYRHEKTNEKQVLKHYLQFCYTRWPKKASPWQIIDVSC